MPQQLKRQTVRDGSSPQQAGINVGPGNESSHPKDRTGHWLTIAVCVLLGLIVWLVFGQTLDHQFVNYDDDIYIVGNPHITGGLSFSGIVWAFTRLFVDQWVPLTAISHMADCHIYGLYSGGHHLTNVLLHVATVILLFLVLKTMTGTFWRSAFVAAVFAIHPLRVESVAWAAERKDVLSGFFFVLTLGAYVRYVRQPFAVGRYLLVCLFLTLGLLSKPMLVTVPFLLLLLDWWPLRRIQFGGDRRAANIGAFKRVLVEKIPLLLLTFTFSAVTILTDTGVNPVERLGIPWRIANALVAPVVYVKQMFYPVGLAVFYPHPENRLPMKVVAISVALLLIITALAVLGRRRKPYVLVGWLWYLGMLVPVIGLMQVGAQAHADRYTYLPQIGLCVLLAWVAVELFGSWRHGRTVLGAVAAVVVAALAVRAHDQTKYWRDSISLWERALACTSNNYLAHLNYGSTLADCGRTEDAVIHFQEALRIKPPYAQAHFNWGVVLGKEEKLSEAISHYEQAIRFKPNYPEALNNLGNALIAQGRVADAVPCYERALKVRRDFPEACYNLGNALAKLGKPQEAIERYEQALRLNPNYAEARYNLAKRLAAQGRSDDAIRHFKELARISPQFAEAYHHLGKEYAAKKEWSEAVEYYERALDVKPDYAEAHNSLGVTLAAQGKIEEAIERFKEAMRAKPDYAEARANLGNALALQNKPEQAMDSLHEALQLATAQTNTALTRAILKRLEAFQSAPPPADGSESQFGPR